MYFSRFITATHNRDYEALVIYNRYTIKAEKNNK